MIIELICVAIIGFLIGGLGFLFVLYFEDEIIFQLFYLKIFLMFVLAITCWIMAFGRETITLSWQYGEKEYKATLYSIDWM